MRRLFVFVLSLGVLAAVTACAPEPPSYGDCSAPAAPGVDWHNCDLSGVNLESADLTGADLSYANLTDANLHAVHLTNANLSYANLTGAVLTDAKLPGANLTYANLTSTNLAFADLSSANLFNAVGIPATDELATYNNTTCPDGFVANAEDVCVYA